MPRLYPLIALRLRATASGLPRSCRPSASLASPSPHRLGLAHGENTPDAPPLFFLLLGQQIRPSIYFFEALRI